VITRRQIIKNFALASAFFGPNVLQQLALAEPTPSGAKQPPTPTIPIGKGVLVRQVMMQPLPTSMGDNAAAVVVVDYAPGAASRPHRHPGVVFGYVLEGAVEIALNSAQPILYHKGDSWYEPPHVLHRVARNKSSTEPARILAFLIVEKGQPLVEPAGKAV
jgi:quercetin dioxygenase-like cupin family protein